MSAKGVPVSCSDGTRVRLVEAVGAVGKQKLRWSAALETDVQGGANPCDHFCSAVFRFAREIRRERFDVQLAASKDWHEPNPDSVRAVHLGCVRRQAFVF